MIVILLQNKQQIRHPSEHKKILESANTFLAK